MLATFLSFLVVVGLAFLCSNFGTNVVAPMGADFRQFFSLCFGLLFSWGLDWLQLCFRIV